MISTSFTGQPHSEVAALAVTFDRLMDGGELLQSEAGGLGFGRKMRIEPSAKGKRILRES